MRIPQGSEGQVWGLCDFQHCQWGGLCTPHFPQAAQISDIPPGVEASGITDKALGKKLGHHCSTCPSLHVPGLGGETGSLGPPSPPKNVITSAQQCLGSELTMAVQLSKPWSSHELPLQFVLARARHIIALDSGRKSCQHYFYLKTLFELHRLVLHT